MGVTVVLSMGPYYQLEHSNPTQQRNLPCWWHPARQWCQPTCSGLSACFMFWADAIHKTQPNFQNTLMETVVLINEKKMATVVTHLMKRKIFCNYFFNTTWSALITKASCYNTPEKAQTEPTFGTKSGISARGSHTNVNQSYIRCALV